MAEVKTIVEKCKDLLTDIHKDLKRAEDGAEQFSDPATIQLFVRGLYGAHVVAAGILLRIASAMEKEQG